LAYDVSVLIELAAFCCGFDDTTVLWSCRWRKRFSGDCDADLQELTSLRMQAPSLLFGFRFRPETRYPPTVLSLSTAGERQFTRWGFVTAPFRFVFLGPGGRCRSQLLNSWLFCLSQPGSLYL
jgi:hypothetical protein